MVQDPLRIQGMEQHWDGRPTSTPLPRYKTSGDGDQHRSQGDPKHKTNYLVYFLQSFRLVYTENLYRHSFIIVDAFPNVGVTARGDGILCRSDELPWNDVRGWQKSRPVA